MQELKAECKELSDIPLNLFCTADSDDADEKKEQFDLASVAQLSEFANVILIEELYNKRNDERFTFGMVDEALFFLRKVLFSVRSADELFHQAKMSSLLPPQEAHQHH